MPADEPADDPARLARRAARRRRERSEARLDLVRMTVLVLALREHTPFARPLGERGRELDLADWPVPAPPRTGPPVLQLPHQRQPLDIERRRSDAQLLADPRAVNVLRDGGGYRALAKVLDVDLATGQRLVRAWNKHHRGRRTR